MIIIFLIIAGSITTGLLIQMKRSLLDEKQVMTKNLVDTAYSVLEWYGQQAEQGIMQPQEAKRMALHTIQSLRYGAGEYFWINDMDAVMVLHPIKPELNGKDLSRYQDPNGIKIFSQFAETVKKSDAGFVFYSWPKPGAVEPIQKISYVKGYKPWGWILGSGVYLDDIDALFWKGFKTSFLILILVSLITLPFLGTVMTSIIRPFSKLAAMRQQTDHIASGNLTVKLDMSGKDEIGLLSGSMNTMVQSLSRTINTLLASSTGIAATVTSLSARSAQSTEGAKKQAEQAQQIATAAEEMSQTITDIARTASSASDMAAGALDSATSGKKAADESITTVNRVYDATIVLSTMVEKLNKRVSEISSIAGVIKGIADQTNLLALNAAIEAARAGEQGRGFAVVADEVRKLAERTIQATVEISEKISLVQSESDETTNSMTKATMEVCQATGSIKNVGSSLDSILDDVHKVRDQIMQIATAVEEQSAASEEVASNIEKTSSIAKEIETTSFAILSDVTVLKQVVEELNTAASGFKTDGTIR